MTSWLLDFIFYQDLSCPKSAADYTLPIVAILLHCLSEFASLCFNFERIHHCLVPSEHYDCLQCSQSCCTNYAQLCYLVGVSSSSVIEGHLQHFLSSARYFADSLDTKIFHASRCCPLSMLNSIE